MKRLSPIAAIAVLSAAAAFALYARAPITSAANGFEGEPEVIAATFNAQWCSACKVLKPRLMKVMREFEGRPVRFVEYDLTFGDSERLREAATADGLASVYDRFSGATGYALIVDAETFDIVDMLTIRHSRDAMRRAIEAAIDKAESDARRSS